MNANNIIDVQQLEITPQDADNTYLGIDENGQLIRTKIELSSGGGEDATPDMDATAYEDGHIKNRTHFIRESNILKFHQTDTHKWLSDDIDDVEAIYILPHKDNENKYVTLTEEDIIKNKTILSSGNGSYTVIGKYPYYIEFIGSELIGKQLEAGIKYAWNHPELIEPLNEAFIPVSIARMEDIDDLWDETIALWENIENIEIPEVDLSNYYTKEEVNGIADTKQNTIEDLDTIRSGAAAGATALQSIPSEYITETELETRLENVGGGGGGSTVVELTGSKPTFDEFNILYESAIAGTPTYVKYSDGMFNVIADLSGNKKGVYHIYGDGNNLYTVYWYIRSGETSISETKKQLSGMYGVKDYVESQDLKYRLAKQTMISQLPKYFRDYSYNFSAPLSVRKNENASMILDGKLYYWDFADTTNMDGSYYLPKIVDLLNISGGDVDLSEYYTKTEIDGLIGDINYVLTSI